MKMMLPSMICMISQSHEDFNKIISSLIDRTIDIFDAAITDSSLLREDIQNIILVGGSSRLKIIKDKIKKNTLYQFLITKS